MLSRQLVLFACLLAIQVNCLTNDNIMFALRVGCAARNLICPRAQYGNFVGTNWKWNENAVLSSDVAARLREDENYTPEAFAEIRNEFCCREGPCLSLCGLYQKVEIDLIKNFASLAPAIFGLNLPELEPYRDFVAHYLKNRLDFSRKMPAEMEEVFDIIFKNQNMIRERLAQ